METEERPKVTKCQVAGLTFGFLFIALACISIPVFPILLHKEVNKKVVLKNGSETYDMWKEPTVPVYMQFYIFDLNNSKAVLDGEKPIVVQRGPYTYREHRKKVDIVHHDNDTVTYRQIKTYHFVRNMSVGPDSKKFTTVNLPRVTLYNYFKWNKPIWKSPVLWYLKHLSFDSFFHKKTVREITFGYNDALLSYGMILDPSRFYTSLVGILAGKNNTDDGVYTIFTGEKDIKKLGIIDRYNGSSSLNFWTSNISNMINGSDGTLCSPFLKKEEPLYMFSTDICRSVYGAFNGTVKSPQDTTLNRYRVTKQLIAEPSINPYNAGFCTPHGNCMDSGVLNISTCQQLDHFTVPLMVSFPHFYLAAHEYVKAIDGMVPDPKQHTTDVDVEPTSGIVMQIAKRLQINIYIENSTDITDIQHIRTMVYPILWLNESMLIDKKHDDQVRNELLMPIKTVKIVQYVLFGLGGLLLLISVVLIIVRRHKERALAYPINYSEDTPDENTPLVM